MSGWPSRPVLMTAAVAALVTTNACARAEPTRPAVSISPEQEEELFAVYSNWRRAVTCSTSWAPGRIAGVAPAMAIGDQALRRLQEAGHADLIARLDARYREIDSRIDWVCGDGELKPPEVARRRLQNLQVAARRLAAAIDDAVG